MPTNTVRGYAYFVAMMLTMLSLLMPKISVVASVLIWATALSALPIIVRRARNQSLVLITIGLLGVAYAGWHNHGIPWQRLLHSNTTLLAMLIAVSFLALVAAPTASSRKRHFPEGKKGLISTLLANHLFGAVINISSIIVIGERLKRFRDLDLPLVSLLSLSFGLCALWSPFFAAMAYTLLLIPNVDIYTVMLMGAPTTAIGIALLYFIHRRHHFKEKGYPLKGRSLVIPCLLASAVIIAHQLWPGISIAMIIIVAASLLVLIILLLEHRIKQLHQHCAERLANFNNEACIFLAAGVFSTGVGLFVDNLSLPLPFSHYGAFEASITLMVGMAAARIGVHAIIVMALFNPLILTLNPPPNLLASTYLAIWGLGMGFNPVSGTLLTIQGQFGVRGNQLANFNTPWVMVLGLMVCGVFFVLESLEWF